MSEAKSVATHRRRPGCLAAPPMCWNVASARSCWKPATASGIRFGNGGHVQLFLAVGVQYRPGSERLLAATGWNSPDPSSIRPVRNCWSATLSRSRTRPASPITSTRRAASPISAAQVSTSSRQKAASSAPFEIRYQNGQGPKVVKADAVIDASAPGTRQSGRRPTDSRHRRDRAADKIAYGMPMFSEKTARATPANRAVLGAGHSAIGPLPISHGSQASSGYTAIWLLRGSDPQGVRRRRQRQAVARGELGAAFAALVTAGRIRSESEFRIATSRRTALASM